jgi:hypothetical protein
LVDERRQRPKDTAIAAGEPFEDIGDTFGVPGVGEPGEVGEGLRVVPLADVAQQLDRQRLRLDRQRLRRRGALGGVREDEEILGDGLDNRRAERPEGILSPGGVVIYLQNAIAWLMWKAWHPLRLRRCCVRRAGAAA